MQQLLARGPSLGKPRAGGYCKIMSLRLRHFLCANHLTSPDMKLFATLFTTGMLSFAGGAALAAAEPAAPLAAASAPAPAAAVAQTPQKPDLVKGQASYAALCVACHGADGNSALGANPKLAQQHPEYLVKQLQEFKAGKRQNPIMQGLAATLSPEDMANIAYWAGGKKIVNGVAKDPQLLALGERIYRGGVADRQIAACAGCHNPTGAGIPAQYPRLGGQHPEYVAAQLTSFRDGVRNNSLQMNQIAAKLNDREIRALADYIAGLR